MALEFTINYSQNTATYLQILGHLSKCDNDFKPKLSGLVNIPEYSEKIILNSVTFEAWKNKELIGLVSGYFNDFDTRTGFITIVSTLKICYRKGIATVLLKMCEKYAIENDFKKINLEVFVGNTKAISLYKKNNFHFVAKKKSTLLLEKKL